MVAINKILLPECTGGGCGGDTDTCRDSRVHRHNAENRVPATGDHRRTVATGRWLTRDPIGYRGGINLYGYVNSSPVGNVDPAGEGAVHVRAPVSFPNNFEPGMGTFSVYLSPAGNGKSRWATGVDVIFHPAPAAKCKCKKIMLVQFVMASYGNPPISRGWHLDNGILGENWWDRFLYALYAFHGPEYYNGSDYPYYKYQTPWNPQVPQLGAHAWDSPESLNGGPGEQKWKEYALCIGRNGQVHSLGYVAYGIDYHHGGRSPSMAYWIGNGSRASGKPGQVSLQKTAIAPVPGGLSP